MNPYKYFVSAELINNHLFGIDTYKDILNLATGAITRKIKKLVFDGTENWLSSSSDASKHYISELSPDYMRMENAITYICSHYSAFPQTNSATSVPNLQMSMSYSTATQRLYIADSNYTTDADFKAYLAQQYANGTPVTVWYVLTESKTETITVPTGLSGTVEGYLNQSGTPTPESPIYPTANTAKGWYNINAYKRSVLTWNTDTAYERSDGSWT